MSTIGIHPNNCGDDPDKDTGNGTGEKWIKSRYGLRSRTELFISLELGLLSYFWTISQRIKLYFKYPQHSNLKAM